jgi:hypothetical protein
MKVTPIKKKFGKYAPGDEFELPDKAAKVLIKVGKLQAVTASAPTYQTRMMTAEPVYSRSEPVESAPYGYKADGTPRARPGRPAKAE